MKICLSRTDSIGDVILSLPMVGFIKKHLPESEVLFLGKTYTRPVIKLNPYVDEFLNWDQMKDKSDSEIIAKLKKLSIDVFIHVFPNKRLAKLVKKAGISRRIGTSRRLFHWLTCNEKVSFTRKGSDLHESELNLKLLAPLFGEFKYTKEEINEFALIKKPSVPENFLEYFKKDHRHIIFHTKSQGSAVEWGAKNFIDLANDLPKDIRIFLTGTSKEGELIRDSLIHPLKDRAIDLTGKMTLDELIAFIGNCDGLVAASTGPLHIAGVCGIHALGLFSNKRPIHPGRWGAIGPKAEFVLNPYWENCDDPIKEINEIPIVVVKRAILSWF